MVKYVSYDIVFQEIPDEVILAINISNCPNGCEGCHSSHLLGDVGNELTESVLVGLLANYASAITCVCFMGGDADKLEVERLACFVKDVYHLKTAWYSGRELFPEDKQSFNYVKLGQYIDSLGGLKSPSTNQRLYMVSDGKYSDITSKFWSE